MKHKDYVRLAKISLNERKNTNRSTVKGITFGLILLLPLLFITMAFYLDLNKTVNKDPSIRNFKVGVSNEKSNDYNVSNLYSEYVDKIVDMNGITTSIKYQSFIINNTYENEDNVSSCFYFNLNGNLYDVETTTDFNKEFTNIGIEMFYENNPILSYEKNVIIAGNTFSSNSKNEIIISSSFVEKYNLNKEDILNKTISGGMILSSKYNISKSISEINEDFTDDEGNKVPLFEEFKIVGIFDSNIYKESIREYSSSKFGDAETYFWFNASSINSNTTTSLPKKVYFEKKGINNYVYKSAYFYYEDEPTIMANNAIANKCLYLPLGFGVDTNTDVDYKIILEINNYKNADKIASSLEHYLKLSTTSSDPEPFLSFMNDSFTNYRLFYKIFTYVCLIFAIFGGVVFFANLLNLYNTINYSVQSRKNYIGMCRAIGMKGKDVIRLYFVEILQVFKQSYIWSGIVGGIISLIIKFLFDYLMSTDIADSITIHFSLNPIYILVAFVVLIINNTIIAVIFAYISAFNVANKPILDTLSNDK